MIQEKVETNLIRLFILKIVSPFKQIKPRVGAGGVCRCHVRMKECCFYFDTQLRLLLLEIREPKMKRALRVMR